MRTQYRAQSNLFQSKLKRNALLQLVLALGVCFILIHAVKVIFIIISSEPKLVFSDEILPNLALAPFDQFLKKPWVLFSYFLGHASFWNLVSNALWLYCFGSVIQTLTGPKEIIPLFVCSSVAGGVLYLLSTILWPALGTGLILTSLPGVVSFAAASIVLAPSFRFHLGERFAIPLWVVLILFLLLNVLSYAQNAGMMVLLGFAALLGIGYIKMVGRGIRPGRAIYERIDRVNNHFAPDPYQTKGSKRKKILKQFRAPTNSAEMVDKILDKINQQGFASLTQEEKDLLKKASDDLS